MTHETRYLPLDEYRYESMLRHLLWMAKQPGAYEYATQRSRELANSDPVLYGKLPADLWAVLKERNERPIQS